MAIELSPKSRLATKLISFEEIAGISRRPGLISVLNNFSGALNRHGGAAEKGVEHPSAAILQPVGASRLARGGGRQGRIRKATEVEDGHSLAEQAVYQALWDTGAAINDLPDADRSVRIGYQRLAQLTRLSWVSVKANLRTLERKLAIQVVGSENSATREGKSYLVYSRPAILERRKRAGLEWVRRTRGVELMTHSGADL